MAVRIDVVFDVPPDSPYHEPTLAAVRDAAAFQGVVIDLRVVTTDTIDDRYFADLPDGVVLGPGTPYRSPDAAELVVMTAREQGLPLVGT